jgi:hypothetical protein
VPSYLGSSFAFIGVVIAATGYAGKGPNANIGVALGGIIACGLVYTLIGVLVQAMVGTGWIERFMPPVVTGAVVAVIGLNLAGIPIKNMAASNFRQLDAGGHLRQRGPGGRAHARHGAAPADSGGPDRGQHHLRRADQRLGLGKPMDLSAVLRAWLGMPASPRPCSAARHAADRPGGHHPGGREPGPHQGRDGHDRQEPGPVHGPRLHWRRHCHHGQRQRRRHWRDHLCREHRRDGGHQDLFHRRVPGGGADCRGAGLFAQVWRA